MLLKLKFLGFIEEHYKWITAFLIVRKQHVDLIGAKLNWYNVTSYGVPVLGTTRKHLSFIFVPKPIKTIDICGIKIIQRLAFLNQSNDCMFL